MQTTLLLATSQTPASHPGSWHRLLSLVALLTTLGCVPAWAQVIRSLPGDYANFAAAITNINTSFPTGGVTVNVAAGYTETLTSALPLLTAQGTSGAGQIIFQKAGAGANPKITASATLGTGSSDYVIGLNGADYVTFDGIDVSDANSSGSTNNQQMEFGYVLFRFSATNGAQNNQVKNCTITISGAASTTVNGSSIGIWLANATGAAPTAALTTSNATTGPSLNNKFNGNTITGPVTGIYIHGGSGTSTTNQDTGNEVGTTAGNTITTYSNAPAYGVRVEYQTGTKTENNTITVNNLATSTATMRGIGYGSSGTINGAVLINNNTITVTAPGAPSTAYGISQSGTTPTSVTITNNKVQNSSVTGNSSAGANWIEDAFTGTSTITGNQVSNNATATTGTVNGIYRSGSGGSVSLSSNTITGNTMTGAAGTMYCLRASTGTITASGNTIQNNGFTSSSGSGTIILGGYYNFGSPTSETLTNNTITGLSIAGTNTGTSTLYGLYTNTTAAAVKSITGNTIGACTIGTSITAPTGPVYGIFASLGSTIGISRNKIYSLTANGASGSANGIQINSGTTTTLSNNLIGNLSTPQATGANAANGIQVAGGNTVNLYYNTVYLNASSTGTTFGSSGIYLSNTAPVVELRNNIVVNTSTPGSSSGLTVALRRATTVLTNYGSASNNNLYYAGPPSTTRLIYYDGSNADQTLTAFKARVTTREAGSVTESPSFTSFVGTATGPTGFLHIDATAPTQVEGGGRAITTINDDYDGDARSTTVGASTDIGADEGSFTPALSMSVSGVSYTQNGANTALGMTNQLVTSLNVLTTGSINALVLNSLLLNLGVTVPADITNARLYSSGSPTFALGTSTLVPTTGTIASPSYTLTLTTPATLNTGNNYYFLTYDIPASATPNNTLASALTSVDVSASTYAGSLSGGGAVRTIIGPLNGTYPVGQPTGTVPSPSYLTITAALADLQFRGVSGPVVFSLINASTTPYSTANGETFPLSIAPFFGSSNANTVTFKPDAGVQPLVSGSSATAIFALNGADNIVFDGSNTVAGTSRDLTITNTSTAANTAGILLASQGTGAGATFVTVKNTNLVSGSNTVATFGVYAAGTTISTSGTGADNDNLTVQNNSFQTLGYGIYVGGSAAASVGGDDNLIIANNVVGPATAGSGNIGLVGLAVTNVFGTSLANGAQVTGNTVQNVVSTTATAPYGMYFNTGTPFVNLSQNTIKGITAGAATDAFGLYLGSGFTGGMVSRNQVLNVNAPTDTWGGHGIDVNTSSATSSLRLSNNFVAGIGGSGWTSLTSSSISGIRILGTSGGVNLYYNSVNLTGTASRVTTGNDLTAALYVASGATALDIRNNIFVNSITSTSAGTPKSYAFNSAAAKTAFTTIDYNDYFVSGTQGVLGFLTADLTTLAAFRASSGTGQDLRSLNGDPLFTSATDLHINPVGQSVAESGGLALAAVTNDVDGQSRSGYPLGGQANGGGLAPDLGADEGDFTPIPFMVVASIGYSQNGAGTARNATNQLVTSTTIQTTGAALPLSVNTVTFDLGATLPADITNAKLYRSTSATFTVGTATLLPTTGAIASPSYTLTLTTPAALTTGFNYFYLTYDIPVGATPGHTVASVPASVDISGSPYVPTLSGSAATRLILGPLNGTYPVGQPTGAVPSPSYSTITAALADLQFRGVDGPVVFSLINASTTPYSTANGETFPLGITAFPGSSGTNTVTFKPAAGVQALVSNDQATALFKVTDVSNIVFDGSNTVAGSTRDLTLTNTSASGTALVWIASSGVGTTNNKVLNLNLNGGSNLVASISAGVMVSSTTYNLVGADNDNVTVSNNAIQGTYHGIVFGGTAAVSAGGLDGIVVTNNIIGPAVASTSANLGQYGLFIQNAVNPVVTGNTVQNVTNLASVAPYGFNFPTGVSGATVSRNFINRITATSGTDAYGMSLGTSFTTAVVDRNQVLNVSTTATSGGGHGIDVNTGSATSSLRLSNNFVAGISGPGGTSLLSTGISGIRILGTSGGVSFYHNSVNLTGTVSRATGAADQTAAIYVATGATALDLRNNIFVNSIVSSSGTANAKSTAFYSTAAKTAYSNINYNDYFVSGSQGSLGNIGGTGANGTSGTFLTAVGPAGTAGTFQNPAGTGQDANSISLDPAFAAATDLHITLAGLQVGTPIGSVTTDIDGQSRSLATPYLGADEFVPVAVDVKPLALLTPATGVCYGSSEAVSVSVQNASTTTALDFSANPLTVTVNVTGAVTQLLSVTISDNSGNPGGTPLAIGTTRSVSLPTPLNMSTSGTYTFTIAATVTGDENLSNDNLLTTPARTVVAPAALPQRVSFAGFTGANLATVFPGWSEAAGATLPTGTTSSWQSQTGFGGTGNVTARVNLFATGKQEWIVAPKVLATATTELSFAAGISEFSSTSAPDPDGMTGTDDAVSVMISTNCGTSFTPIYTFNAANQPPNGSLGSYSISLASYAGQQIIVAFRATEGASNDLPDYDFHVDDLVLRNVPSVDVSATALVAPAAGSLCRTSAETVTVAVKNTGSATLDLTVNPISISVSVTGAVTAPLTGTLSTGTLLAGQTVNVSASAPLNMSTNGTYTFAVSATATGDGDSANDNLSSTPTRTVASPTVGTLTASTTTICAGGGGATVTLTASATNGTIQFQQSSDNVTFTPIAGATTSPYTTAALTSTTYFRAVAVCGAASSASSNVVAVVDRTPATPTAAPTPGTVCQNTSVALAVTNPEPTQYTYTNSTSAAIPDDDFSELTSTLAVSGVPYSALSSGRLKVRINITHPYDGDLYAVLEAPDGATYAYLIDGNGGSGDNFINTVFDDNAATSISTGTAPFTGTFRPLEPLSIFNGLNPNGTWKLYVGDYESPDAGTLNSWSLTFDSPVTYTWSGPGLTSTTGLNVTAIPPTAGTATYNVTVTREGCTSAAGSTSVTVLPAAAATLSNNSPVCSGNAATATVTLNGSPGPWNLSYTVNSGSPVSLTNQTSPVTINLPASTVPQTVQLTALADAITGCAALPATLTAANTTTVVHPLPTATLSNSGPVCEGNPATVTVNLSGVGPFNFTYTVNGANPVSVTGVAGPTYPITNPSLTQDETYALTSLSTALGCSAASLASATTTVFVGTTWTAGAGSSDWYDVNNWSGGCLPSATRSAFIPNGVTMLPAIAALGAAVKNLTILGTSTLAMSGTCDLDIKGSCTMTATMLLASGGTVTFSGPGPQSIPAASFYNLVVDGPVAKVLSGPVNVAHDLDLSAGLIALGNADLRLLDGPGTILGADASHFLITNGSGRLAVEGMGSARGAVTFPIGSSASSYTPATLANAGTPDVLFARVSDGMSRQGNAVTTHIVNKTWDLGEGTPGGSQAAITLQWNAADEIGGFNRSVSDISHYVNGEWSRPSIYSQGAATTVAAGVYSLSRGPYTSFSPFGIADAANPLPVELTGFEARRQDHNAELSWTTASEKDNRGFEVQLSTDGREFRALAFVASPTPTSTAPRRYDFTDTEANKAGRRYYRLRQLDFNGTEAFSPVRSLRFEENATASLTASPNPFRQQLTLRLFSPSATPAAVLTLTDASGRQVREQKIALPAGSSQAELRELAALPPGVYFLHLALDGKPLHLKVVKE